MADSKKDLQRKLNEAKALIRRLVAENKHLTQLLIDKHRLLMEEDR